MNEIQFYKAIIATRDATSGNVFVDAGRCKDCKHWTALTHSRTGFGDCWMLSERAGATRGCPAEHLKMVSILANCYSTETAAEFGCVLWEAKT